MQAFTPAKRRHSQMVIFKIILRLHPQHETRKNHQRATLCFLVTLYEKEIYLEGLVKQGVLGGSYIEGQEKSSGILTIE